MRYVLDCSVATKWFVAEVGSDIAERVLIDQQSGRLSFVAPDILIPELAGTLTKHVARGTVKVADARYALAEFLSMHIELFPSGPLAREAFDLAVKHSGTLYDALYVALARRENIQVLTADTPLVTAFGHLDLTLPLAAYS